ncbi:MAG: organic hydroperoxide resistance protein [Comamonadaceae bacterium]|nr:organic hydroperoxide resistance protein [Comamonadaceae bacterium]
MPPPPGGQDGKSVNSDGLLDVPDRPRRNSAAPAAPPDPSSCFAAGYSACFLSALKHVGRHAENRRAGGRPATASVGVGPIATGFSLNTRMVVQLARGGARHCPEAGRHPPTKVCPYSNATRGNIDVVIELAEDAPACAIRRPLRRACAQLTCVNGGAGQWVQACAQLGWR